MPRRAPPRPETRSAVEHRTIPVFDELSTLLHPRVASSAGNVRRSPLYTPLLSRALCRRGQLRERRQRLEWSHGVCVERRQALYEGIGRLHEQTELIMQAVGVALGISVRPSPPRGELLTLEELQHLPRATQNLPR